MAVRHFRKLMLGIAISLSGTAALPCFAQDQLEELRSIVEQQGKLIEQLQQQLPPANAPPANYPPENYPPENYPPTTYPITAPGDVAGPAAPLPDDGFVDVGKDLSMTGGWKNGLHLETKDKAFRIHPVGRLQVDGVWIDGENNVEFGTNGVGDTLDAMAFRRMRVGVEGTFWEVCNFNFEPDLANTVNSLAPNGSTQTTTVPVPVDNWVEITQLPWLGNVRVGNVKPEYDFEHLTSSNNLDFMERSLLFDAYIGGLDNGFQPGVVIYDTYADQRIRFANSFTKNNQGVFGFNTGEGEYNWTTRLSALPIYEHEGRCLVHVGFSYSHKDLDQDSYRYRARTTLRNGPSALQTTLADVTLAGNSQDMIIPELVVINGPLSILAEYSGVWTNDVTSAARGFGLGTAAIPTTTVFYEGFQVNVMYFLTGEHRPYNRRMHFFDRPVPYENFFRVRGEDGNIVSGRGAWQVGARYSQVNFNDAGTNGGIVRDVTLGLNWYLNPNLKFQFDTIINEREIPGIASNGYVYGFGTRMALQF